MPIIDEGKDLLDVDGKTYKYYILAYKESEHWYNDSERSNLVVTKTDKSSEVAEQIYYYKVNGDSWDVYLFVKGVPTPISSFDEKVREYEELLERRRQEYQAKLAEQEQIRQSEARRQQEEFERKELRRLKAKFGNGD